MTAAAGHVTETFAEAQSSCTSCRCRCSRSHDVISSRPYTSDSHITTSRQIALVTVSYRAGNGSMVKVKKGKGRYSSSWEPHPRAMGPLGRHLPYGITQYYLPSDTSKRAPPNPRHTGWYSIYLPRTDGRLS